MENSTLAIVVPCFNEEAVLQQTNEQLRGLLDSMMRDGLVGQGSYMLYVDDGSRDQTWSLIARFSQDDVHVRGLKLAANVGHQNALMAGLEAASKDADLTVSIDADLQDDIKAIPEMVKKFDNGCDIVYGVRRKRTTDTFFKRTTAQMFYKFMSGMGVKSVYNHADFRLMSRRAVEALCQYEERNLFLRGLVPLLGYQTDSVYYDRLERQAGESKYPLSKMLSFAIDGVTSFSVKPLRLIFYLGALFLLISLGILVYVIVALCQGRGVQGWASLMLSIWFVGGCLLICLSVIAAYIGRIYTEGKHRPRYNIEKYLK
ncbi:MAG: glycosyltransferase family 2 protein [Muribaculaceae bacterium]|nr:glycosyltransferase family 2 protein [Muribaculaceae bacterium]